ncbi:MAG: heme exporter protein CcmD [Boseongicola sp.]
MPDLGKYAVEVGLAYVISLALLLGVVWISAVQSRNAKRDLDRAEDRWSND